MSDIKTTNELLDLLIKTKDQDELVRIIYDTIDEWHSTGRFDLSDEILVKAKELSLPKIVGLAFLSITRPASPLLKQRQEYFNFYKKQFPEQKSLQGLK